MEYGESSDLCGKELGAASKRQDRDFGAVGWELQANLRQVSPSSGSLETVTLGPSGRSREASFSSQVSVAFLCPGPWPYAFLSQRGTRLHHDAPVPSL